MGKKLFAMPALLFAGLCVMSGCAGKSTPATSSVAPAAPASLTGASPPGDNSAQEKNAPQGGGIKLDAPAPDGGGVKNP